MFIFSLASDFGLAGAFFTCFGGNILRGDLVIIIFIFNLALLVLLILLLEMLLLDLFL
jgi:hypothetical protein